MLEEVLFCEIVKVSAAARVWKCENVGGVRHRGQR